MRYGKLGSALGRALALLSVTILRGDWLCKDEQIVERTADHELPHPVGLDRERSLDGSDGEVVLVECLAVGHGDPANSASPRRVVGIVVDVQEYLISFDDGEVVVMTCGTKAQPLVEGQCPPQVADYEALPSVV
jgi:hypothetical protein